MKYFIFFVILSLVSARLIAQQNSLNDVVSFRVPQGVTSVQPSQMRILSKSSNKYPRRLANSSINKGEFFSVGNFALHLNANRDKVSDNFLLKHKMGSDDLARLETGRMPQGYTSEIKKINGNTVLIVHNVRTVGNYFMYRVVNSTNTRTLIGSIDYDRSDGQAKAKAEKMMYEILNSLVFK